MNFLPLLSHLPRFKFSLILLYLLLSLFFFSVASMTSKPHSCLPPFPCSHFTLFPLLFPPLFCPSLLSFFSPTPHLSSRPSPFVAVLLCSPSRGFPPFVAVPSCPSCRQNRHYFLPDILPPTDTLGLFPFPYFLNFSFWG